MYKETQSKSYKSRKAVCAIITSSRHRGHCSIQDFINFGNSCLPSVSLVPTVSHSLFPLSAVPESLLKTFSSNLEFNYAFPLRLCTSFVS